MDVATEPPRIVLQGLARCADAARIDTIVESVLSATRAPGPGWRVTVRFQSSRDSLDATAGPLRGDGEVTDAAGTGVAHRILSGSAGQCAGLARAIAVWASLVLDEEVERARSTTADAGPTAEPAALASDRAAHDGVGSDPAGGFATSLQASAVTHGAAAPAASAASTLAPYRTPVTEAPLSKADRESLGEIGLGTFVMAGTGANAILGATPYVLIEASSGLFLRPALMVGQSVTPLGESDNRNATWVAARLDGCARIPGNYVQNRGMEVDFCGGAEGGITYFRAAPGGYTGWGAPADAQSITQLFVGPSVDLGGELGNVAVILRGVVGANLLRDGFTDTRGVRVAPSPASGRAELAVSWRLW